MNNRFKPVKLLSVIIVSSANLSFLEQSLNSLRGQGEVPDTEVIVVSNNAEVTKERIESQYPYVKCFCCPVGMTIPQMRSKGIAYTSGEIIALTEDNSIYDENWCNEIKKAHKQPHPVIGGSVENGAHGRALDWAVYFYEYGKYMLPNQQGIIDSLPGNNVTYKRSILENIPGGIGEGFYEVFVHRDLRRRGIPLYLAPGIVIYHNKTYDFKSALSQFYFHGRSFAGMRVAKASSIKRLGLAIGSWFLPFLLPMRIVFGVVRKGRNLSALCLSLPYLIILMGSWALGEFMGYLLGEGDSSRKWT